MTDRQINFHNTYKTTPSIPESPMKHYALNDLWEILVMENYRERYEIMIPRDIWKNHCDLHHL